MPPPVSLASQPEIIEKDDPPFPPLAEALIQGPDDGREISSGDLLEKDPWEMPSLFSLPLLEDGDIVEQQCLVEDFLPDLLAKEIIAAMSLTLTGKETASFNEDQVFLADSQELDSIAHTEVSADTLPSDIPPRISHTQPQKESSPLLTWSEPFEDTFAQLFLPVETEANTESNKVASDQNSYKELHAIFPSLLHEKVGDFIVFFQQKADTFFANALARSQSYAEMMKNIFREKNLPEELFYLALIESGYNPKAFSRAKASGIWQFISKTAKRFGLKVDKWVDERLDPEKSTYAAADYLRILYEIFQDWDLVAASYNAGEGKVLRAMKKANSQDFWEISRHRLLKQETKKYVPMFLAAVTIANEPQKYGFSNLNYHPPLLYEKVVVPPGTSLMQIAKAAETDLSEIQALNLALKRGKTPPYDAFFEIKIPPGKKDLFEKNFPLLSKNTAWQTRDHRVRPGETLWHIAKRYRVSIQDICQQNNLSPQARLKVGTTLLVPR